MKARLAAAVACVAVAALGLGAIVRAQETPAQPQPAVPVQPAPPPAGGNLTAAAPPPEEAPPAPPVEEAPVEPDKPAAPAPPPKPAEPLKRTRHDAAILQATDKITAETLRFQAKVGAPVRFKDLVITVRACETTAPDEAVKDSIAHLDVSSQPPAVQGRAPVARSVYRGWMFAGSPGLHPFEHPVYDLWLITCRTVGPSAPGGKT